jgi:diacylglycerol kinase (ATP)
LWDWRLRRYNPGSLRATAIFGRRARERHLRPFRLPGVEFQVHADREPLDSPEAALFFGGDGTLHHYLPSLIERQIPFLVVPIGSGNDFAHAVGVSSPSRALAAWQKYVAGEPVVRAVDAGEIVHAGGKTCYCCVAGAGLDSATNRLANAWPAWLRSRGGYALSVVLATATYRAAKMTVESGAAPPVAEPAMMVAVANAPSYGAGMEIAPRARLDDHLLDVCFVRRVNKLRLLRLFPRVYCGRHVNLPQVAYFQTDTVRLMSEPRRDVYADGEYVGRTPVEIRVLPAALRVIVNP